VSASKGLAQRGLAKKAVFVLLCLAFAALYCNRIWRVYSAQHSAQRSAESSAVVPGLDRAIKLNPQNAVFPHLLGLQLSENDGDYDSALANLRQAVALNPYKGRYWLDLASLYQEGGDIQHENAALQSALTAEPGNPEIAAEAAQYYLAEGDASHALPLVRQALDQNPRAAPALLATSWRATRDANLLLTKAIPLVPQLQLALLQVLVDRKQKAAADETWQHIVASRRPFPPELSAFYFEYLIKENDVPGLARAWNELAQLAPGIRPYLPTDNLIVNPGFEQPVLSYGLDWRHQPAEHISAGIDDSAGHSGARSLTLAYDGNPGYDAGWIQFIPVQPNAAYNFSAWIKSKDVTTSSGPRIAIVDAYTGANLLLTDDVLDTHPWHELQARLQVPAGTSLVEVKIIRAPANTKIRGQIWIDDLRLNDLRLSDVGLDKDSAR
jgi:tetratricopeptide (TPR) repeat protein